MAIQIKMKVEVSAKWWKRPILWLALAFLHTGRWLLQLAANRGHDVLVDGKRSAP